MPIRSNPQTNQQASSSPRSRWRLAFASSWRTDWLERSRDWRVWAVLVLGGLIATVAAITTAIDVQHTLAARSLSQQAEQARWLNQGQKYPHSAAHYGVYVFKPLSALAAVDPGVEKYVGSSVWLEAHKQNEFVYRAAQDESGSARQLSLTPAFALQVLAPLAIIFLGFGVFAGERERGTLRTLSMTGAPMSAVAAARALVLLCLGLALAVPSVLAVAATHAAFDTGSPFVDGAVRLWVFSLGYVMYLALWCAVTVWLSALMKTLRSALSLLIVVWAATALILPRIAVEWSQAAASLPSTQAFREALDGEMGEDHDPAVEAKQRAALLKQYGVADVKDLPVNWSGISLSRGEARGDEIFDKHYQALFAAMDQQSRAVALMGWLSPTIAVAGLSSAAAATNTAHHVQYVNAAEGQRRVIQKTMNDFITANVEKDGKRVDGGQALWGSVKPFQFVFAPLSEERALLRSGLPLLVLLLIAVLLAGLSIRRLRSGGGL